VPNADKHTAVCESIVWEMWEPRRLTTLWASRACYTGMSLPFCDTILFDHPNSYFEGTLYEVSRCVILFIPLLHPLLTPAIYLGTF
jgi:hypothetical protein